MSTLMQRSLAYIQVGLDFFILHSGHPNILGLVTNDTCNLHCIDCRVANVSNDDVD